jgi:hypothetical protein
LKSGSERFSRFFYRGLVPQAAFFAGEDKDEFDREVQSYPRDQARCLVEISFSGLPLGE